MKLTGLVAMLVLAACSNRGVYEGLKEGNRQECNKMPEYQRQQCLNHANQSYEDYQRERDALKTPADR